MAANQPEKFEEIKVSLPPALAAFVKRKAKDTDHTTSGLIRHFVAEAARAEPPPTPSFPVLENVPHTPAGVAAARARQAAKREELARLEQRRRSPRGGPLSADDDMRASRLSHEIAIIDDQIAMAERFLPRPANGGA